ncbi:unnamed protein product [Urochloa decumbens]|uniref:Uncharacterized protein n=1 Tax=Urochloa decumbens TaxID=240449 RepID=A0ABC9A067_9POAL
MARTENNSATYACSGNPCIDFFFHVVPDTPPERIRELLAAAWARDPLTALKLVCNLHGVRGTGKSDREGFYATALWVHAHVSNQTLAGNVPALAEFGYLKDFPELLYRLVHGADARKIAKAKADADKMRRRLKAPRLQALVGRKRARAGAPASAAPLGPVGGVPTKALLADFVSAAVRSAMNGISKLGAMATAETEEEESHDQEEAPMEIDHNSGKSTEKKKKGVPSTSTSSKKVRKVAKLAVQSLETYYGDRAYRFLFDCVANFFADLLASDVKQLAPGGKRRKIGLAAKCTTPTAYRVLHRLRREVLVPLRKVLDLPEVYMSAQRWSELPYTRVASVAMRRYKDLFKKHDEARFGKYLEDVEAGKAKIAAGALLPHEIAAAAYRGQDDNVSELQWRRMVEDLRKKGSLSNCIAVCDVSASMNGQPMEVCIALGLLISELSEKPWAGRAITFSSRPQIHTIKGKTLQEKLSFVRRMDWGGNTNFQAVFDRILQTAVDAHLAPEKMIRTLFVFSDMEFNMASANPWETDYQAICRKFRDAGYGDVVPQIVFWNLRDSRSTPVTSTQPGVAMVSGFSKNLVKLFLENDGVVNPEAVMAAAIAGEEYQKLAVFD